MKRSKFSSPIKSKLNSIKKTKVQFSTRLSSCLGEHQSQEFFERLNITRQSGICSKNKNNSFGDNKSHSFRQTLQLNIPFIADLSDFKELCICYPVHFFRRKLQSYDNEDSRLASVRVYYPASRMKHGNDFKVSVDLKKRIYLQPHQYEFVAYSSLLTLSLEDLALAVFRAKSLSEKFKIIHSLPIPKILLSSNKFSSQIGTPIFIGTERIYSRLSKLIACSKSNSFHFNNSFTNNSDSDFYYKKCILRWVGLSDFLPLSSRLVFVRQVSLDSGNTLGCSILNSPGPKIRRCRIKGDRLSIRLKQARLESTENRDLKAKILIEPIAFRVKCINSRFQNNKRPRGRPKKVLHDQEKTLSDFYDDNNINNLTTISSAMTEDKVKDESLHLKTESISNSLFDSTSEEKYSIQLSTCSTPDTIKSRSPMALTGSLTTTINSTASISQVTMSNNDSNVIMKNKRGRPRKYLVNVNDDSNIKLTLSKNKSGKFEVLSKFQGAIDIADDTTNNRKRSINGNCSSEPNNKNHKVTDYNLILSEQDFSKVPNQNLESLNQSRKALFTFYNSECLNLLVHSMWKPLDNPLPPPDPIVPTIKLVSSTGMSIKSLMNAKMNGVSVKTEEKSSDYNGSEMKYDSSPNTNSFTNKTYNNYQNILSKEFPPSSNFKFELNLTKNHNNSLFSNNQNKTNCKENNFLDDIDIFNSSQYLLQNSHHLFNSLMLPPTPSSLSHNNNLNILSPYFSNNFNSRNSGGAGAGGAGGGGGGGGGTFDNFVSPVTYNLASMLSSNNPPSHSSLRLSSLPVPSQILYDTTGNLLFSSTNCQPSSYNQNSVLASNTPMSQQHPSHLFNQQQYNHVFLANRFELSNPELSWNNGFQWKY